MDNRIGLAICGLLVALIALIGGIYFHEKNSQQAAQAVQLDSFGRAHCQRSKEYLAAWHDHHPLPDSPGISAVESAVEICVLQGRLDRAEVASLQATN